MAVLSAYPKNRTSGIPMPLTDRRIGMRRLRFSSAAVFVGCGFRRLRFSSVAVFGRLRFSVGCIFRVSSKQTDFNRPEIIKKENVQR